MDFCVEGNTIDQDLSGILTSPYEHVVAILYSDLYGIVEQT